METHKEKLVAMFKWFHELCETENITYYAICGTALGAIRHNGFIPWDDDIDVGIPRPDYERLLTLTHQINGKSKYYIEKPLENKDYIYPFTKIYDTSTTLIEKTRNDLKRGIYIDVFPLDGIGNSVEEGIKNYKTIKKLRYLHGIAYCCKFPKTKNIKILIQKYLGFIIRVFAKESWFINQMQTRLININYNQNKYIINAFGGWHEKEISKREWLGTPKLQKFEGLDICCPEDCHSYLTGIYGDYMQLPPEEERVTHHNFIYMNLHESYLEGKG